MANCTRKWFIFSRTILFKVTQVYWKMCNLNRHFYIRYILVLYSKCHNVSNCSAKVQTTAFAIPTSVTRCLTAFGHQEKMQLTKRSAGQGTGSLALSPGTRGRGPWGAAGQGFPGLVTITNIFTVLRVHTCLFDVNTFALRANQDPIECLFKLVLRPQGTTTDLDTTRSELRNLTI